MDRRFSTGLLLGLLLGSGGVWLSGQRARTHPVNGVTANMKATDEPANLPKVAIRANSSHRAKTPAAELPVPARDSEFSRFARLLNGEEVDPPTREQVEPYLAANKRSAESLLGAFYVTKDPELLEEALNTYPNDPRV